MDRAKRRGLALMVIALILATVSGCFFFTYLQRLEREIGDTIDVVAASRDIRARTLLTSEMLTMKRIPRKYALDSYVLNPADIVGTAVTLVDMHEGDILQRNTVDQNAGLDAGMRALSIAINQVTSVGGNVRPGNRVDIVVSYKTGQEESGITTLLLQDVEVLAVSSLLPPVGEEGIGPARFLPTGELMSDATVTLALKPEDALKLIYMSNFAKEVRLMIRRLDERELAPLAPVSPSTFR